MFNHSTREARVAEFNQAADGKTFSEGGSVGTQVMCFDEEVREFATALADYVAARTDENRAKMIKEWADVQVTLSNFAWFFEFDADVAFNRVANSNMTKFIDGKPVKDENGKVIKGEAYVAPDMKGL